MTKTAPLENPGLPCLAPPKLAPISTVLHKSPHSLSATTESRSFLEKKLKKKVHFREYESMFSPNLHGRCFNLQGP